MHVEESGGSVGFLFVGGFESGRVVEGKEVERKREGGKSVRERENASKRTASETTERE